MCWARGNFKISPGTSTILVSVIPSLSTSYHSAVLSALNIASVTPVVVILVNTRNCG